MIFADSPILGLPMIVVLLSTTIASVTDVWKYRIYNALTLPLLVGGLVYQAAAPHGSGVLAGLIGASFGFATLIIPHAMGGMGAGDVKLMAAVGAWLGLPTTLDVFIASALAAGFYSLILIAIGRNLSDTWDKIQGLWIQVALMGQRPGTAGQLGLEMDRPGRRRRLIPFATMMVVGILSVIILPRFLTD